MADRRLEDDEDRQLGVASDSSPEGPEKPGRVDQFPNGSPSSTAPEMFVDADEAGAFEGPSDSAQRQAAVDSSQPAPGLSESPRAAVADDPEMFIDANDVAEPSGQPARQAQEYPPASPAGSNVDGLTDQFSTSGGRSEELSRESVPAAENELRKAEPATDWDVGNGLPRPVDDARIREQRLEELSRDWIDNAGKATPGTRQEAEAALGLEERGELDGPIRRPMPGDGHSGDFVDASDKDWDVKRPMSRPNLEQEIRDKARATGRPEPRFDPDRRLRGEFDKDTEVGKIRNELRNENVIIDTRSLTSEDLRSLRDAVEQERWGDDKVKWWP
jgi:hypothetical protein